MALKEIIKKISPNFLIDWYHLCTSALGAAFYRFPSREIAVIGVTGTNSKSTVVELTTSILEGAGHKVASFSSIKFKIGEKEQPNLLKMTMPGRFKLQRLLRQAVESNCKYAIVEVTSEGIKQHRHRFVDFKVAVFTNLSPEHIEAHGGFDNYKKAKGQLFKSVKEIHVINLDDENAGYFLHFPAKKKYGYGMDTRSDTSSIRYIRAVNAMVGPFGVQFFAEDTQFSLSLLGNFNIYNALAAICVGLSQNISLEVCQAALKDVKGVPGRMEEIISSPFRVVVDYAFTPNALEKAYKTIKDNNKDLQQPSLICVLGAAGGGRDKWKRPVLGEIAGKYCDEIIITNEDPYDEDPRQIMKDVASGTNKPVKEILDRKEAVRAALELAHAKDSVIITGKGSEPWMCVAGGKKIPWDDREIVKEEFKRLNE